MDFDPGHLRVHRGRVQVVEPGVGRADQHDVIGDLGGIELAGQDVDGGNVAVWVRRREMRPYPAGPVGWHDQRPDLDRIEPGVFAKALLTVGAGALGDIRAGAGAKPQRLGDQRRHRLVAEPEQQRHMAHHPVPFVRELVIEAVPGRRFLKEGQRGDRVGEAGHIAQRVPSGPGREGEPGLYRRVAGPGGLGQREADDDRQLRDRLGQALIRVRHLRQQLLCLPAIDAHVGQQRQQQLWRGAVGFGEDHVEHHYACARFAQFVDELGHDPARPRPLADPFQAAVVDVDDADRHVAGGLAWRRPLVGIEREQRKPLEHARDHQPRENGSQQDQQRHPENGAAVQQGEESLHGGRCNGCLKTGLLPANAAMAKRMIAKFGEIFQRRFAPGRPDRSVLPETGLPRPRAERNLGAPLEVR